MKGFTRSLRWQVQAWHGAILLAVLSAFGSMALLISRDTAMRRVDQQLQRYTMAVVIQYVPRGFRGFGRGGPGGPGPESGPGRARPFPPEPRRGPPNLLLPPEEGADPQFEELELDTIYYRVWSPDGEVVTSSTTIPEALPDVEALLQSKTQTSQRGIYRESLRVTPSGFLILVGHNMEVELAALRRLAWSLAAAGGSVLFLGLAGGWWLSTRAIRPIRSISAAAERIAAGNLAERIDTAGTQNELSELARVLNTTFDRLQASFARQARFTADASHELRTPVTVILTQSQSALKQERSPEEYREALDDCQRAARRMRGIIEQMLVLARQDAGEADRQLRQFDLAEVTREATALLESLAGAKDVTLHLDLKPVGLKGDPERLALVVSNLVGNAIHYNRSGGDVWVETRDVGGSASLVVRDTGPGIHEADLPRIFDRFYRAELARSRAEGRSGLGLAICKSIVEAHGGTIEVRSREGEGSVFTVMLPVA